MNECIVHIDKYVYSQIYIANIYLMSKTNFNPIRKSSAALPATTEKKNYAHSKIELTSS